MKSSKSFVLALTIAFAANAQQSDQKATGNAWLDVFAGKNGAVIYPQYTWSAPTPFGNCGGYGFVESAPGELLFNNNLVNCTPSVTPWFTIHAEIGDVTAHQKGFVQLGPQVNLNKVIPGTSKAVTMLWASYLPAMAGIRTNNFVIAGASRQFPVVGQRFTAHVEAFDRIFGTWSYGEIWTVGHVRGWKHIDPVVHVIRDSSRQPVYTIAFGFRLSLKP